MRSTKEQNFTIGHRQMMANLLGEQPDEVPQRYEVVSPITHAGPNSPLSSLCKTRTAAWSLRLPVALCTLTSPRQVYPWST
jgi:hypothetical protein